MMLGVRQHFPPTVGEHQLPLPRAFLVIPQPSLEACEQTGMSSRPTGQARGERRVRIVRPPLPALSRHMRALKHPQPYRSCLLYTGTSSL